MYLIVLMQLKNSFLFGKFRLLTAVNFHTSILINKQCSLYNFKLGTYRTRNIAIVPNWPSKQKQTSKKRKSEGKQKQIVLYLVYDFVVYIYIRHIVYKYLVLGRRTI